MTITQKMQSPWYFTELRPCNITLENSSLSEAIFQSQKHLDTA